MSYPRTKEPECSDWRGHNFRPVGGCEENPGFESQGEMMLYMERCKKCQLAKRKYTAIANTAKARMQETITYSYPWEDNPKMKEWTTYKETCFMTQYGPDRRASGDRNVFQVRYGKKGWEKRACDSNGQFFSAGNAEPISDEEGQRLFALTEH